MEPRIQTQFQPGAPDQRQDQAVQAILSELWRQAGPTSRITLIGSRARGNHRPDSDIDVMIETLGDQEAMAQLIQAGPELVRRLEANYGIRVDANLAKHRDTPTVFRIAKLDRPSDPGYIETDKPCPHPGQDRCGDCHACGQHRRLDPWRLPQGTETILCIPCYDAASHQAAQWRRGDFCSPTQREPQGNSVLEILPHHQGCLNCFELQPQLEEFLQQTAEARGLPGPRNINGLMSYTLMRSPDRRR